MANPAAAAPSAPAAQRMSEPRQREALVPETVAQHAGEHADQHAHQVEHRGDQAGLDQREAELVAQPGDGGRDLGHVRAGDQAAGEDGPDCRPIRHAAVTGIFSSTIFFDHSAGPVVCTDVPLASTATVTGMSFTSNS